MQHRFHEYGRDERRPAILLSRHHRRENKEIMNQLFLNLLWHLNRVVVRNGLSLRDVSCIADSDEETMTYRGCTWHRVTGTRVWQRIKPLQGNLITLIP
jgi:hypothetical protein